MCWVIIIIIIVIITIMECPKKYSCSNKLHNYIYLVIHCVLTNVNLSNLCKLTNKQKKKHKPPPKKKSDNAIWQGSLTIQD